MRHVILIMALMATTILSAQQYSNGLDTLSRQVMIDPEFTLQEAIHYLKTRQTDEGLWRGDGASLRSHLSQLVDHTLTPYDSIAVRLQELDLTSMQVVQEHVLRRDSVEIRWLNDSSFIIDSVGWSLDLLLKEEVQLVYPVDFSELAFNDSILDEQGMLDTALFQPDTISILSIDTAALRSLEIPLHQYSRGDVRPPVIRHRPFDQMEVLRDPPMIVFTDTVPIWRGAEDTPFNVLSGPQELDSVHYAIATLLAYNEQRDSTRILLNDMYGKKTPLWITQGSGETLRFWVKNYRSDSITLWIGNPAADEISLLLEDAIDVNRMEKLDIHHLPERLAQPERNLVKMSLLVPDPYYWDYNFSSAFTFNQTYLSNWSKGGESSLTTMLDIMGGATYNNKEDNTQWINSARIKFGTLITDEKGLRKNNDLFEINSKFNRNASGKIGFSASLYMKNQLAKGYKYPNDSVIVSKFLNPGSLTVGLGAEYKPFKHTTINMAPLSYKNTFVLDTATVDQTKHGVDADKRSKQELGTQIVVSNKFSPMEDLTVTNNLRLFSNYLNHPENIDIDWELMMEQKINWFFTIRLNLHLIYDDDIRFPVLDENDQPVLRLDGSEKKVAKAQFKEFVGLSLVFKF